MNQRGFATFPLVIIVLLVIAGVGGYLAFGPKAQVPAPQPKVQAPTSAVTNGNLACNDFAALSDYVLKNIMQPDSQNTMQMNKNVITSLRWKRSSGEPFVSYPIINGVQAYYGDQQTNHTHDFVVSTIKKDSDIIGQTIDEEVKKLGLSADSINTLPFQSFPDQDVYLRTFGLRGGDNLYNVVLKVEGGGHQAPPQGVITITCGRAVNQYDKVYNALNFKADPKVRDIYDNDYVAIADVSSDNTVYALIGSTNHIKIADYYYFDGNTAKLVSEGSYPTQCANLESQKVGKGMRCVDVPSYTQRQVTY